MSGERVPDQPGVTLERSELGGLLVMRDGVKLGWIHDRDGKWHAYLPTDGSTGTRIGRPGSKMEAVKAVITAAAWRG